MTKTDTSLANFPSDEETRSLLYLCLYILQPIRDKWGLIKVNSGYRSDIVNDKVGGSRGSQHLYGEAADIVPLDTNIDTVFEWLVNESNIPFGQAILENKNGKRWIHVSLPKLYKPSHQALVFEGDQYKSYV